MVLDLSLGICSFKICLCVFVVLRLVFGSLWFYDLSLGLCSFKTCLWVFVVLSLVFGSL